jgi:hypothetical protein
MKKQKTLIPISSNRIELVMKTFSTNKIPGPDDLTDEFYQTFKNN